MSDDRAAAEVARLSRQWPAEFRDGARAAFHHHDGARERGGYPAGFHQWPQDRRNAWWGGFNKGLCDRTRLRRETP